MLRRLRVGRQPRTNRADARGSTVRLLIEEVRVKSRREILPTYRVVTPEVSALSSSLSRTDLALYKPNGFG